MQIFQKRAGHVRVEHIFKPLLFILPTSLLGQFFNTLFKNYFGELAAIFLTMFFVGIITFFLYAITDILPIKRLFSKNIRPKNFLSPHSTKKKPLFLQKNK